jgi:hypothetical protein
LNFDNCKKDFYFLYSLFPCNFNNSIIIIIIIIKKNMIVEISQETMLVFFKKEVLVLGVGFFFFSRIKVFKLERKLIHLLKRY